MEDRNPLPPEAPPTPPATPYPPAAPLPAPGEYSAPARGPLHKSPLLAGFLSFMPGLGNIYNGLYLRGIAFFFLWAGTFATTIRIGNRSSGESETLALMIPACVFLWLFNLFDAYRQASLINHGYASDLGLSDRVRLSRAPGGMVLGVAILLIGVYGLLERFFNFDLSLLLEYWHVGFIGFGIWLIIQARNANAQERAAALDDEDL